MKQSVPILLYFWLDFQGLFWGTPSSIYSRLMCDSAKSFVKVSVRSVLVMFATCHIESVLGSLIFQGADAPPWLCRFDITQGVDSMVAAEFCSYSCHYYSVSYPKNSQSLRSHALLQCEIHLLDIEYEKENWFYQHLFVLRKWDLLCQHEFLNFIYFWDIQYYYCCKCPFENVTVTVFLSVFEWFLLTRLLVSIFVFFFAILLVVVVLVQINMLYIMHFHGNLLNNQ